ncbi:MOSC domain-containing protein [Ferdinandcohnia quinoae]|uniref:MOSC domain-containing protein n=1 Tax=Fredinandcohnia quinoae TaxID=2918902 RepID=A0AAW5DX29_9BACI|nr:MOSC domain-containing protein [Fredinandcohnia sp. SECRCQ15]MCH1624598.1 MOSC domain-containing protein [Fredinandcohnia sp. SECRCQ15]
MSSLLKGIFVGKPKTVGMKDAERLMDREWSSGMFKEPVQGPIWLGRTNLDGDGQADLIHHGGPEKAVFVYSFEHYMKWQEELGINDMIPGGMGENFSVEHLTEKEISIGDIFQIGDAVVQVSQPRQPCWKPARRYNIKKLPLIIQNTGRTGWYFRVLQEGFVEAGQKFTLVERPFPNWTVEVCNQIMHHEKHDFEKMKELAACELLAPSWKASLVNRVKNRGIVDISERVIGPNE